MVLFATPFGLLSLLLGAALAAPLVVAALRRPDRALLALAVILPLQKYLVAALYQAGLPIEVVRGAGWVKEALVLGVVASAVHAVRTSSRQLDVIDRLALAWIAGCAVYFFLPGILSAPGAPTGLNILVQGFRANAMFVLLFLGARHAPLPPDFAHRFRRVLMAVIVLVAAAGIYQFIDPQGWIRFTFDVVGLPQYQSAVQGLTPVQLQQDFGWLFLDPVRVGSVLISPFEFVDLLLVGLALVVDRLVRGNAPAIATLGAIAIPLALLASRTRINLVAAAIVLLLVLRPAPNRVAATRARVALLVIAGAVLLAPTQIGTRVTGADGGAESSRAHVEEFMDGLTYLIQEPRGSGLGTSPGVGARFGLQQSLTSDNAYLQVGNELGLPMMVLFVVLLIAILRALHRAEQRPDSGDLAAALRAAGIGLCLVGMLHHVWLGIPVAWLFFAGAGVALSSHPREGSEPPARASSLG
jgi:hypothetical protein